MTKTELFQILAWRLGDRDDLNPRMETELNFVQDYVLEANAWLPWFLVTEESEALLVAGERRLPLPTDFLSELEESALWLELTDGTTEELPKGAFDVLARKHQGEGKPLAYSVQGEYFHLFPIPDLPYKVFMRYNQKDSRITDEGTPSRWLKYCADLVLAELGFVLAGKHIKDAGLAAAFQADAQASWKKLYDRHIAQQEINQARSMGGNS